MIAGAFELGFKIEEERENMPTMSFDSTNKTASVFDVDRLRFTEKDEKARILLLDDEGTMMYRHFIRTPNETSVGRYYACIGDFEKLYNEGADDVNCPACAASETGNEVPVREARMHFALNIAKYHTTGRQAEVVQPISLTHAVWVFSQMLFNKLIDYQSEYGDLRKRDLRLTCTSPSYQNIDMMVMSSCAAVGDDSGRKRLRSLLESKFVPRDLELLIARTLSFSELTSIVEASGIRVNSVPGVDLGYEGVGRTVEDAIRNGVPAREGLAYDGSATEAVSIDDISDDVAPSQSDDALLQAIFND